jgi:CDP-glycerol glycerophosphotransferase
MKKKISVIIPVYNTTEFLEDCIQSITNQTYKNLEIIIINDGSSEECRKKLESLTVGDDRIQLVHLEKTMGVGAARNIGLSKATGDYVYFLDSDDYLPENILELLAKHIGKSKVISGKLKKVTVGMEELKTIKKVKLVKDKKLKFQYFKNMSVLNRLFKLSFIRKHNIKFAEDVRVYSDLEFLLPIYQKLGEIPMLNRAHYYKRKRNDPILNPALLQMDREEKVKDFLKIYNKLRSKADNKKSANRYLDNLFLNFFRKEIIMLFKEKGKIEKYFDQVSKTAEKIDTKVLSNKHFILKKEIKHLRAGNEKKFTNVIKLHHMLRDTKKAITSKSNFYKFLYRKVFMKMPLQENQIVFESFLGKNYSDSPKYMYEYMIDKNMDYKYIWIFNEPGKKIPGNAKQIKRFSLRYFYYLATSKYWVSNSRLPKYLDKREGNIYIQTWHGTPLKRLVFDMNDVHSANPNYKRDFYQQSRRWDYLVSANQYSSDIFRRAFLFDKQMLEVGYPRNDILYHPNKDEIAKKIKQKLNIPLDKKIILYAPTWRDDDFYEPGKYKFNLKLDLKQMKERLGDEYVVILRMHYFIADDIETTGVEDFAYNLSKYDDIAELYLISDILITDYSSVFFDYANLQRPILFYTYDLEKYRDTLRGFYIDMENDLPGPLLKTSEEVIETIVHIEEEKQAFKEKYDLFYEKFCKWDNGKASEKVVKEVFM